MDSQNQKPDGDRAFPMGYHPESKNADHHGMTLRDYFAAAVIGPLMASNGFEARAMTDPKFNLEQDLPKFAAQIAYCIADAMIAERMKAK